MNGKQGLSTYGGGWSSNGDLGPEGYHAHYEGEERCSQLH